MLCPRLRSSIRLFIEREVLSRQADMLPGTQLYFWDPHIHGLGLKLTPNKAVYIVQRRVRAASGEKYADSHWQLPRADSRDGAREGSEILRGMRHGSDPIAEKKAKSVASKTLRALLDEYLDKYDSRLREKTKVVYRSAVQRCFADWLDLPVSKIDEDMVAARHTQLSNANGPRGKGEAQADQAMRVLRTLFNFAKLTYKDANKKSLITINPVESLKARRLWNKVQSREEIISDEELHRWYQAVLQLSNETVRDYMLLCLFTGLRRTEAAKLKWCNVKFEGARPLLTIPAQDTKTNSELQLPLSDFLGGLVPNSAYSSRRA